MGQGVAMTNEAGLLEALVEQIDKRQAPAELLALATEIDQLGRQIALTMSQHAPGSELAAPLRPVLLAVPAAYAQTLLRAAEKYDDIGSPRRAVFALVEALRKAFEANMVAVVGDALAFTLEANDQPAGATRMREIMRAAEQQGMSRRELRERYLEQIAELHGRIDWNALEDEPGTD